MEEIKDGIENTVKDRGFVAAVAGIAAGYIAKRFTRDTAGSAGLGLVVYSLIKRI